MTKDQREFKARWDEVRAKCEAAEKAFAEYMARPGRKTKSSREYMRLWRELKKWECKQLKLSYQAAAPTAQGRLYAWRDRGGCVSWHAITRERPRKADLT